jgi:hypothetical protein
MILTFALLAIVPPLQAAAPPTSPVRLTMEQAQRRACQGLPIAKHRKARLGVIEAVLGLQLADQRIATIETAGGEASEALAINSSEADRAQATAQIRLFAARRLNELAVRRERLRLLQGALGVPTHREVVVTGVTSGRLPTEGQLREVSPQEVLRPFYALRDLLDDLREEPRLAALKPTFTRLADINRTLIVRHEDEYDRWAKRYNWLDDLRTAMVMQREAYGNQQKTRRQEYIAKRSTMDLFLESQRFRYEAIILEQSHQHDMIKSMLLRREKLGR